MSAPGTVLVTGAAGFIGSAVAARLSALGWQVATCDNFNDYYAPELKHDRVAALLTPVAVRCDNIELADPFQVQRLFRSVQPTHVVHLAAQAGVRYSLDHPEAYVQSNLVGFANVLEASRKARVQHLVYASSSSVYGANNTLPFREDDGTDMPLSFYAATKKANEVMAHSYAHLYALPCTGLRFFTVYGPWGRPDMACWRFARAMLAGESIAVYAEGRMQRDFTYIDDVVEAIVRVLVKPAPASTVFNVGNGQPVSLGDFIAKLELALGVRARRQVLPMQAGDMPATWTDTTRLRELTGWTPSTPLDAGLERFAAWFRDYAALR